MTDIKQHMFETYEGPLKKIFTKYDCITTDNHFVSEIKKFVESKEYLSEINFSSPISGKKPQNQKMMKRSIN